jgi:hypothetical protein
MDNLLSMLFILGAILFLYSMGKTASNVEKAFGYVEKKWKLVVRVIPFLFIFDFFYREGGKKYRLRAGLWFLLSIIIFSIVFSSVKYLHEVKMLE